MKIYGGFDGTETLLTQRNWSTQTTVLSGDIGTIGEVADNSYHVVTGSGVDINTLLDGFTITGGNAILDADSNGGGIYNINGSPTLNHLIITNNHAKWGAGMYNEEGSPILTNITFSDNFAMIQGAGMYNVNSNPLLTNVTFVNNQAYDPRPSSGWSGGGMYNLDSNPVLMNVAFVENSGYEGGGMYNNGSSPILTNVSFIDNAAIGIGATGGGGGMGNSWGSSPVLTNVTFSGNSAWRMGGGMFCDGVSNPVLMNVNFINNSGDVNGGGIGGYCALTLMNAIFWGNTPDQIYVDVNTPTITYSVIQNGCPAEATCSEIITDDPLLADPADNGGFTQTFALEEGSPAIDAGNPDPATCPATDQRGYYRPVDGDDDGVRRCDMGAYEYGATGLYTINLPLILR